MGGNALFEMRLTLGAGMLWSAGNVVLWNLIFLNPALTGLRDVGVALEWGLVGGGVVVVVIVSAVVAQILCSFTCVAMDAAGVRMTRIVGTEVRARWSDVVKLDVGDLSYGASYISMCLTGRKKRYRCMIAPKYKERFVELNLDVRTVFEKVSKTIGN